ncbi:MAG: hypothetical protein GX938_07445 [Spirochaetales bacterium]|nr:hypothetical protein [Spirochaetales bacterium]
MILRTSKAMGIFLVLLAVIAGPSLSALALDGEGAFATSMGGAGLALGLSAD